MNEILYSHKQLLKVYSLKKFNKKHQMKQIGSKAKSLINLSIWGFTIPDTIILDYSFYDAYKDNKELEFPPEIIQFIETNLDKKLAIRSSCSLEDGFNKSYAGVFKTTLNVPNKPGEIKNAIHDCYQHVSRYLNRHEKNKNVKMGIIVQSLVPARISGIIFTSTIIVNSNEERYQIEFCSGYGDQLTGGGISGDSIILDKNSGKIIEQRGTIFISQRQIDQLRKIAKKLEKKTDFPQDAEFVISENDERIFMVQSRPITAFEYTPEHVLRSENEKIENIFEVHKKKYKITPILTGSNVAELFTTATPLSYSIFKTIFAGTKKLHGAYNTGRSKLGYKPISPVEQEQLFITIGDQPRTNLLQHALIYCLKGIRKKTYLKTLVKKYIDDIYNNSDKSNYAQFGVYIQNPSLEECHQLFNKQGDSIYQVYSNFINTLLTEKIPRIRKNIKGICIQNNEYYLKEINHIEFDRNQGSRLIYRDINGLLKVRQEIKVSVLLTKCKEYINYLRTDLGVHYVIIARIAFLCSDIVKKQLEKLHHLYPRQLFNDLNTINEGFSTLLSYEQHKIEQNDAAPYSSAQFNKSDINIFRLYEGYIGTMDISESRIGELEDKLLFDLIKKQNHKKTGYRVFEKNNEWLKHFLKEFAVIKQDLDQEFENFESWLQHAAFFMIYRERMKSELLKIFYLIRIIINEIAAKLNLGKLIYYLKYNELEKIIKNSNGYRLIALKRQAYFHTCKSIEVDRAIMAREHQKNISIKNNSHNFNDGEYRSVPGQTIYHGEAEGFCLTAENPIEFHRKLITYRREGIENIIGVFKSVDPAYFKITELTAFITERGGFLAHAATIARENNLPYISNIKIDIFNDGQFITFDTINNQVIYREQ